MRSTPLILLALLVLIALSAPACSPPTGAAARPRNVILIVVDTLRADHLGVYGYGRDTSPHVDAFARRSVLFQDVRFGVTPLARSEALEMVRGIRGFKLLEGVRGEPGADLDLLAEVLLRLAQLARRHPRIQELDVNPFLAARGDAARALDARIRVAPKT